MPSSLGTRPLRSGARVEVESWLTQDLLRDSAGQRLVNVLDDVDDGSGMQELQFLGTRDLRSMLRR